MVRNNNNFKYTCKVEKNISNRRMPNNNENILYSGVKNFSTSYSLKSSLKKKNIKTIVISAKNA